MTSTTGRTVLVTGANRGIGRAFVAEFLARGAATVYAGARDPGAVDTGGDDRIRPVALDVSDPASVAALAAEIGDVDVVVNNAGVSTPTSVLSDDTTNLRREMEVNFFGPLSVTSAFADGVARRGGAVVNISSALAWFGMGNSYSASKAALWSATESMRLELGPRGVQVLGVYFGYVDTDMTADVTEPKSDPADIVATVLDALEAGAGEVLADQISQVVKAGLSLPPEQRYAALMPA